MVKDILYGLTEVHTLETSMITSSKAMESITGQMGVNTKVPGAKIRCMALENLHGPTDEVMKGPMIWTKKKEMECSYGQMARNTQDYGMMGSNMVQGISHLHDHRITQ